MSPPVASSMSKTQMLTVHTEMRTGITALSYSLSIDWVRLDQNRL